MIYGDSSGPGSASLKVTRVASARSGATRSSDGGGRGSYSWPKCAEGDKRARSPPAGTAPCEAAAVLREDMGVVLLVVQMVDSTPDDSGKSVEVGVGAIGGSFDATAKEGSLEGSRGMNEGIAVFPLLTWH